MHPLLRPRHLAVTALVFLVMGGAGAGLVGSATADEARQVALVEDFHIPLPKQGDRGSYSIAESGWWAKQRSSHVEETSLEFQWFEDRFLPTRDGELVLANRVRYHTEPDRVNGVRGPIMEAGSNVPFAHEWMKVHSDPGREEVDMRYDYLLINDVPCMLRHGLQGTTFDVTSVPVRHDMPCQVPSSAKPLPAAWRPVGVVAGSDPTIVVFEAHHDTPAFTATTRMWLQDGLAYPVRYEEHWERPLEDPPMANEMVYTLHHLDHGDPPLATQPVRHGLPELRMQDTGLPGDDVLDMTFPLAEAVRQAGDDAAVAAFLDAHPAAYLVQGDHLRYQDDEGRLEERWDLVWTNGTEHLGVAASKTTGPVVVQQPVGPVTTLVVPVDAEPEYEIRVREAASGERFPAPGDRVRDFPTMASMAGQWDAVAGTLAGTQADTWGFDRSCACGVGRAWVGASIFRWDDDDPFGRGEDQVTHLHHVMAWNGTQVDGYTETRDVPDDEEAPTVRPQSLMDVQVVSDAPWLPLTAKQAAGVTLGAAIAALAYWLYPVAKQGLLSPLFSRIRDDEVLDHPVRREAFDAIQANPGIHHKEIARLLGKGQGTVTHHLRRLEGAGRVRAVRQGRYTCYFAKGTVDHRLHSAAGALRAAPAQHLLADIVAAPGLGGPELFARASVAQSTLQYHLKRLRDEGLVENRRDGRRMTWHPTQRGQQAVAAGLVSA